MRPVRLLRRRRPGEAPRVRVAVHRGGPQLEALLARTAPGAAELVLVGAGPDGARFLHRRAATLTDDAGREVEVTLLAVADETSGAVRPDVVHAVALDRAGQRREHARITVVRPVTLVPEDLQRGWLRARTRDLSAGGALVSGAPDLRPGHRLRLLLDLADQHDTQVDVRAVVVRAGDDGLRALDFGELRDGERDRIARWVRRREVEALRRRAGG